jgi:hypothetical protein
MLSFFFLTCDFISGYHYKTSVSVQGIALVVKAGTARGPADRGGQVGALHGRILHHAHTAHVLRVFVVRERAPFRSNVNTSVEKKNVSM